MQVLYVPRKSFVCPDPKEGEDKKEAFAQAAKKVQKKQPQRDFVPRGGSRGRVRVR